MRVLISLALSFAFVAPAASAELADSIISDDGTKMVLISAGKFTMGSNDEDISVDSPFHDVFVSDFYMDVHEVTNGQFSAFLNATKPAEGRDKKRWNWLVLRDDLETEERFAWWPTEIYREYKVYQAAKGFERHPVITVNWHAADAYCKWAGKRLPTEAEWEKAARGGLKKKRFPWGNEIPTGGAVFERAWNDNQSPPPTAAAGTFPPNKYGLHDMSGNVWEWVSDWYDEGYYNRSPEENPKGPKKGEFKVLRGGAWHNLAINLRIAIRNFDVPESTSDGVGFRCAKDPEGTK